MCLGDASCGDESVALTFPQVSSFNLVEPVHVRKMLESREERKAGCEHRQRPAGAFGVALQSCVPGLRRRHRLAVAEASVIPLLWYAASWYCRIVVRCARRTFILGFLRQFVRCTAQCWVPVWQHRHLLAVVDSVVIPLLLPAAPWYCHIAVRCVGTIFFFLSSVVSRALRPLHQSCSCLRGHSPYRAYEPPGATGIGAVRAIADQSHRVAARAPNCPHSF